MSSQMILSCAYRIVFPWGAAVPPADENNSLRAESQGHFFTRFPSSHVRLGNAQDAGENVQVSFTWKDRIYRIQNFILCILPINRFNAGMSQITRCRGDAIARR